jgi:hypothetical protein
LCEAGSTIILPMHETDSSEKLRVEFNRWAEAGRGEEMEESPPSIFQVLTKHRL